MEQSKKKENKELELSLDFAFQAPIDLVFDTLTKAEHIKQWHSPDHLNITFAENDLQVGGEYKIGVTVADGDGTEMMFIGEYLEINRPHKLVYTQSFSPGNDAPLTEATKITIQLKEEGNETLMSFQQSGFSNTRALQGARMSWPQAYSKLGKYLEELQESN